MKSDETPVFYRNRVVDKLVRVCLTEGKKETSRDNVLWALEAVKRRQYKAWRNAKTEEEKNAIELDPFVIANKALLNCRPLMKILPMVRGTFPRQLSSFTPSVFRRLNLSSPIPHGRTRSRVSSDEDAT